MKQILLVFLGGGAGSAIRYMIGNWMPYSGKGFPWSTFTARCMEIDKNCSHIEIDKRLKGDDFITCVLHELVHVKQQFKGELKEMKGIEKMWKGEVHICIDYMNLPWEKEAYAMQETLLIEFKKRGIYA
mgnify:CR=1 FL=1